MEGSNGRDRAPSHDSIVKVEDEPVLLLMLLSSCSAPQLMINTLSIQSFGRFASAANSGVSHHPASYSVCLRSGLPCMTPVLRFYMASNCYLPRSSVVLLRSCSEKSSKLALYRTPPNRLTPRVIKKNTTLQHVRVSRLQLEPCDNTGSIDFGLAGCHGEGIQ